MIQKHNLKQDLSEELSNSEFTRLNLTLGISKRYLTIILRQCKLDSIPITLIMQLSCTLNITIDVFISRYFPEIYKTKESISVKNNSKC